MCHVCWYYRLKQIMELKQYNFSSVFKMSENLVKNYKSSVPLTKVCLSRTVFIFGFLTYKVYIVFGIGIIEKCRQGIMFQWSQLARIRSVYHGCGLTVSGLWKRSPSKKLSKLISQYICNAVVSSGRKLFLHWNL